MPSGGYGIDEEDFKMVGRAFADKVVQKFGMEVEWAATYATARAAGATPAQAAAAAYYEWDL